MERAAVDGGRWRCQRLGVGDGVGGRVRLAGMRVETRQPRASHCVVVEALPVVRALVVLHELAWAVGRC